MGPASSGPDTLMDLATRCAGNSVRPGAPTWLVIACGVARGLVVEQPRQETAARRSVGIGLSLIMFMTSLPFCFFFLCFFCFLFCLLLVWWRVRGGGGGGGGGAGARPPPPPR